MSLFNNIKLDNNILTFDLSNKNIKLGLANALRRIILSELPMIAIDADSVKIYKNTSSIHDGILKHRITLVPIKYDFLDKYELDKIYINLNILNEKNEIINITTNDFSIEYEHKIINNSEIFYDTNVLYTKLKPTQELNIETKLKRGIAKNDDATFSHAITSVIIFKRDENEINRIIKELDKDEVNNFLLSAADNIYMKTNEGEPAIYQFKIESIGVWTSNRLFSMSLNVLKNKLMILLTSIKNNNEDKIKIDEANTTMEAYNFTITDEDDTLGNLLQNYLNTISNMFYAGYLIPHPNDNILIIRTSIKEKNTFEENKKVFIENIENIIKIIDTLSKDWFAVSEQKTPMKKIRIKKKK